MIKVSGSWNYPAVFGSSARQHWHNVSSYKLQHNRAYEGVSRSNTENGKRLWLKKVAYETFVFQFLRFVLTCWPAQLNKLKNKCWADDCIKLDFGKIYDNSGGPKSHLGKEWQSRILVNLALGGLLHQKSPMLRQFVLRDLQTREQKPSRSRDLDTGKWEKQGGSRTLESRKL